MSWATIKTRSDGKLGFNWSYVHNESQRESLLKTFHELVPRTDAEWSVVEVTWVVSPDRMPELQDFARTFDHATLIEGEKQTNLHTGQSFVQPDLFGGML